MGYKSISTYSLYSPLSILVENKIKHLLEKKHLYQNLELSTEDLKEFIAQEVKKQIRLESSCMVETQTGQSYRKSISTEDITNSVNESFNQILRLCVFLPKDLEEGTGFTEFLVEEMVVFNPPTINAFCVNKDCKRLFPHNHIPKTYINILPLDSNFLRQQIIFLRYQCQNCKKEELSFLIKKDGLKLTLCGRSPIEHIEIPKYIPTDVHKFYRGAVIAFNSGALLPSLFMLRTTIEQYMLNKTQKKDVRIDGDALADAYAKTLDPDFNSRFQSLKPIYSKLSEAIHLAEDKNLELFNDEKNKMRRSF